LAQTYSYQEHVKTILSTHKPVVSDVFMAVQGYRTVAYHVAILRKGVYHGSIAILIPFKRIAKEYLEDVKIGERGYAWMISEKGVELFCPVPGHTGKTIFQTSEKFPSVIAMAGEMMKGRQGNTTYVYDRIGGTSTEPVKNSMSIARSVWGTPFGLLRWSPLKKMSWQPFMGSETN
jgi:hypothetical protein